MVISQPDLGTSLTYVAILAGGILLAGIRWKLLATIVLAGALAAPVVYPFLSPYQQRRVTSFLDPLSDPRGSGYQVIQSRIAIGHGGIWGTGTNQGTQTQLRFIPVAHTDFIFSAFAEEHGFVGVVLMLGLYFLFLMQIVQNAQAAPRPGRHVFVHGGGDSVALSHSGERRNGTGPYDCDGDSAAADERGRIAFDFGFHDAGAGEQRPAPAHGRLTSLMNGPAWRCGAGAIGEFR